MRLLQRALKTNRYGGNFYKGNIDGRYGPLTAQAVKRAKYWLGYRRSNITGACVVPGALYEYLTGEKKLSPLMRLRRAARVRLAQDRAMRLKALDRAKSELGYREGPNNCTKFGAWYGMNYNPWCAMFVSWCYAPYRKGFRYAWVPAILADAKLGKNGLSITKDPKPGDLVVFGRTGTHVGLFLAKVDSKTFRTVEGNIDNMVARKRRLYSEVGAFVHVSRP